MVNSNTKVLAAIAAVINGTASCEEQSLVDGWLLEDENNHTVFNNLRKLGYNGSLDKAYQAKEKIFIKVQKKTQEYLLKRKIRIWQYTSAACIAACLLIGGLSFFSKEITPETISYVETTCMYGTRSKVILSDGSTVELNSGSVLRYPNTFAGKERIVQLTGEGYFDVSKDKEKPFVVATGTIQVKVLGTLFNLKAYKEDAKVVTTLLEGSVSFEETSIQGKAEPIVLIPNQQLIFDKSAESINIHTVEASLYAAWKSGTYYFDNETFLEIARKLERGFNVQIKIGSERLEKELFSGVFDKGESIQQILDLFKRHRYFDYKQSGSNIEIYEK